MSHEVVDRIASRWGVAPDDAINYATIRAVEQRSLALAYRDPLHPVVQWVAPYRPPDYPGVFLAFLDQVHTANRPINRLLSLCCGHGHAERALARVRTVRSCDGFDVSPAAVANAAVLAKEEGHAGFSYQVSDLNTVRLHGTYDFVYAGGVHHLENLEHIFAEVRAHLAPGAPFMMYEYIGRARCQYTARQVELINACIRLLPERLRVRVSSQRELGAASPFEAYAVLQRERARLDNVRPLVDDVFPLKDAQGVNEVSLGSHESGLTVETPPGRWEYAVVIPCATELPERPSYRPLMLTVDAEVRAGQIGLGCVAADRATFLDECIIEQGPRTSWSFPLKRAPECRWLVVRNTSTSGASRVDLHSVRLTEQVPQEDSQGDERPLATDPRMRRHFLTEFVPMTPEQWLALDPSESVRSDEIIPLLRATFPWVDIRYMRGSVLQFVLLDLAANFYEDAGEAQHYLEMLFHIEDVAMTYDDVPENFAYIVAADRDLTARP